MATGQQNDQTRPSVRNVRSVRSRVAITDNKQDSDESHFSACENASVYLTASLCMLILAAVAYVVSISSTNWSVSGQAVKMGIWDYCVLGSVDSDEAWKCYPVNADFSVATQVFGILAIVAFACGFLFYLLQAIFHHLRRSKPLTIGMTATVFCIVTLQLMMLIVFALGHGSMFKKIVRDNFSDNQWTSNELFLSWGFYFTAVSTILATVSGVLLFIEFRNLAYLYLYGDQPD